MKWNFTDIKVGMQINVQAYKHNGFLYRQWSQAKVIFHNKRHIVLSLKGTKVIEIQKNSNGWKYNDDALWFIPKYSMYNSIVMIKKNIGNSYYINLSSYPIFEDNTIKFIDYDLDCKSYPNKDLQIVDREEFKVNSEKYSYPKKLKELIFDSVNEIVNFYNNEQYFFSEEIILYYLEIMLKEKLIDERTFLGYYKTFNKNYNEETEMFKQINKNKKSFKI
ncbi:DUF402 domain-containing protein [Mycoplasmopsis felis]|uniref:DUF402 domain-containing protein n=1 Tax=Mycoplasmopsis felis TaxID=33923 RepID=UPI00056BD3A0|nr:DUF402 domain-containing protein [Mycoplasmopsis felis]MCU9934072.1 DUF402 domain-containing protein [Mycoplasmopsis felis]MCU9938776.1 DUF402 domain-containing protein [Mycoplasmopsis felis]MCU9939665.1 DUF402 domain-containing protein [Mycoplasmopsis felis]UWV79954.1 DUF402 domain-containing protein [Mycoplasmopsis felis]UWV85017.1 DUF402 domain-containing protein [Mycoplasmopsis felis]